MPYTVNTSFSQYREYTVDLDREETKRARVSRDYLKQQINKLADNQRDFPKITKEYQAFGSFARNTKVRPLDDIDIMVILNGSNTTATSYASAYTYRLQANNASYLWQFTDDYGYVNSTRILNRFRDRLSSISNYRNATINKRMQAVVLNLVSYAWSFDIVPAVPTGNYSTTTDYYLIPDGKGNWIRTDPRRDQTFITDANKRHNSNLIPLIRLLKYWNMKRYSPPKIGSYYLETMIVNGFKCATPISSIKNAIPEAFRQLGNAVITSCLDPKKLGPPLENAETWDTRLKVREVALEMANNANNALRAEQSGNHELAIGWWDLVFPDFPKYG